MRSFWSFVVRDQYSIGCTGQSVYVYENGCEVFRLSGFQYTYKSCISPNLDFFALKSNIGIMYVYSLKDFKLVKKVRFMKTDSTQDCMFTFSLTGDELISVDHYEGVHHCITHYTVPTLEIKTRYFHDSDVIEPCAIEPTCDNDLMYALMQERNMDGIVDKHSVALIKNGKIEKNILITQNEFELYSGFKELQAKGFTEKSKEWSLLKYRGYDLSDIEDQDYSISKLFDLYEK